VNVSHLERSGTGLVPPSSRLANPKFDLVNFESDRSSPGFDLVSHSGPPESLVAAQSCFSFHGVDVQRL
jgi:hypothetical protein